VAETELSIHAEREGDALRLAVTGELDIGTKNSIIAAASEAQQQGVTKIDVDVSEVTFCDSSGISALVMIVNEAAAAGRQVTIVNPRTNVRRVLEIAGVFAYLTGTAEN
jgi:anti-sigma B factor antagonist